MLVQALDGYFYKNPILYGSIGMIDFTELIGRVIVPCRPEAAEHTVRRRANALVREIGIKGRLRERSDIGTFVINGSAVHGMAFHYVLLGPIPPESLCIRIMEPREHEDCFGFVSEFYVADLVDWLNGGERIPLLERALLGEWGISNPRLVKRRLFQQHSWLRGLLKVADTELKTKVTWWIGKVGDGDDS